MHRTAIEKNRNVSKIDICQNQSYNNSGCSCIRKEIDMSDNRESKIHWLNWKEMFDSAEEKQDEHFFELSAVLANTIEKWCGSENLLEWAGEDLCEEVGFDPTVMVHVRNTNCSWDRMTENLLSFSEEHPEMIIMVTFIEGDSSGKTYLHGGRLTTALYDSDNGKLFLAF